NMKRLIKHNAKQVGILYHFTSAASIMNILKEDKLESNTGKISFTRNQFYNEGNNDVGDRIEGYLQIDGNKLSNNYKIKPFHDQDYFNDYGYEFGSENMEQEERLFLKDNNDLYGIKKYITKIVIFKNDVWYSSYITRELLEKEFNEVPKVITLDMILDFINIYNSNIPIEVL
ncbi:MAG: hypothetical protein ACOCP8_07775, partial [archaeon]